MLNAGVDFGSTYTTVSVYREDTQVLEALLMNQSSPYVPSVVSVFRDKYEFGRAAKKLTGKKGASVFKGFKMMLPENDQEELRQRGFTEEYTPGRVTGIFLENLLRQVLKDCHEEKINRLVVGVPEIWNDGMKTIDGRTMVRDICQNMDFIESVQIVSEPAAASAFFAYNFQISTGNCFEGKILLIDYGGGTLDITLTDVRAKGENNEEKSVEIKVDERTGAGENENGQIGKAGIVYMESVVKEAIRQAEVLEEGEEPTCDGKFLKAVDMLEEELQDRTDILEETFEEYGVDYPDDLEEEFTTIEYKGEDIPITYRLLLEVYNDTIRDVFDEKLNEMIQFMETHGINYEERNLDNFKIALVGGFGNFYLVKKQVKDKFSFSEFDKRQQNIILNRADCEKAVSLGAALLSADLISIRNTAPYSIGICVKDTNGEILLNYAFRYNQDIKFKETYFPMGEDQKLIIIFTSSGGFSKFIINKKDNDKTALIVPVKEEFQEKLSNIIQNEYGTAVVGFSLDASGIVSIHVHDYDLLEDKMDPEGHTIELSRFNDLFDLTKVEKAVKG